MKTLPSDTTHLVVPLAKAFAAHIRSCLNEHELAMAVIENRFEKDERICHTHNFSACATGGEGIGVMSDEMKHLWGTAWTLAKKNEFKPEQIRAVEA
jgi:hypothetical protein